ncbi:transposase [Aetokthonos hydrillicola Thurmond2011]|uniref:Transposase n=1 Tax=Aetokthonos hydrillicola Thurmond2011 TaxID=2712845 RepID=A0AAP5I7Q3_9CYAN|nr:transposase [Aetokthonos hydrillicola Thurmond2011]
MLFIINLAVLLTEHGWKLIALEIMPDHVHCFLNVPPHESHK